MTRDPHKLPPDPSLPDDDRLAGFLRLRPAAASAGPDLAAIAFEAGRRSARGQLIAWRGATGAALVVAIGLATFRGSAPMAASPSPLIADRTAGPDSAAPSLRSTVTASDRRADEARPPTRVVAASSWPGRMSLRASFLMGGASFATPIVAPSDAPAMAMRDAVLAGGLDMLAGAPGAAVHSDDATRRDRVLTPMSILNDQGGPL